MSLSVARSNKTAAKTDAGRLRTETKEIMTVCRWRGRKSTRSLLRIYCPSRQLMLVLKKQQITLYVFSVTLMEDQQDCMCPVIRNGPDNSEGGNFWSN